MFSMSLVRQARLKKDPPAKRLKIPLEKSRNVYGVCDQSGLLEYGTCFFQPTIKEGPQVRPKAEKKTWLLIHDIHNLPRRYVVHDNRSKWPVCFIVKTKFHFTSGIKMEVT